MERLHIFKVVCDLLDMVQKMNVQLSEHAHEPTPVPVNAASFAANAGVTLSLLSTTKPHNIMSLQKRRRWLVSLNHKQYSERRVNWLAECPNVILFS